MKAENLNPGGSVKDRAALYLIKDAEEKGSNAFLALHLLIVLFGDGDDWIGKLKRILYKLFIKH